METSSFCTAPSQVVVPSCTYSLLHDNLVMNLSYGILLWDNMIEQTQINYKIKITKN